MYIKLLVVAALISATLASSPSQCETNYQLPNLESGSISMTPNSNSSSATTTNFQQTFSRAYSQVPTVALTLQSFNLNSNIVTQWEIRVLNVGLAKMLVGVFWRPVEWAMIGIRFLAGSRPDVIFGATTAVFGSLKANTAPAFVNFQKPILNWNGSICRAFISGWKQKSGNQTIIRVFDKAITANRIQLAVQVAGSMQISQARLDFILFNPNRAVFASYGGVINENNLAMPKLYNIQKSIYKSPYSLFGLNSLWQTTPGRLIFISSLSPDFYLTIQPKTPIQQFFLSYIILGVGPASVCGTCSNKIIYEKQCGLACPGNTYPVAFSDGGKGCRECPDAFNMVVNRARNGCQCKPGMVERYGFCVFDGQAQSQGQFQVTKAIRNADQLGANTVSRTPSQNIAPPVIMNRIPQPPQPAQVPQPSQQTIIQPPRQPIGIPNSLPPPVIAPPPVVQTPIQSFPAPIPVQTIPQPPAVNVNVQVQAPVVVPVAPPVLPPPVVILPTVQNCSLMPNMRWDGFRCVCVANYTLSSNGCVASQKNNPAFRPSQFLYKISLFYKDRQTTPTPLPNPTNCRQYQFYTGQRCDCIEGYYRHDSGSCFPKQLICPANSIPSGGVCICIAGFIMRENQCVPKIICGENSYDNGLGLCICITGYVNRGDRCVPQINCPPNSSPDANGNCVCNPGHKKFDGNFCSMCPTGQVWINNQCMITCGVNQVFNPGLRRCQCITGLAIYMNVCSKCPLGFFPKNGFCVTCPIYSQYNPQTNQCSCQNGRTLVNGICQDRCPNANEVYSPRQNKCLCIQGLARIRGACQLCVNGFIDPETQQCLNRCKANQVLRGGQCVCDRGFGRIQSGDCVNCNAIGGFESLGYCVICPFNQQVIGGACGCPPGRKLEGNRCVDSCRPDQLIDSQGFCYTCPINEISVGGKCECKQGFRRVGQLCQIQCQPNQVIIQGVCAVCAMGTILDPQTRTCICPPGYFTNNYGICELTVPTCVRGTYLQQGRGCLPCPLGCSQCTNANTCTSCSAQGFAPVGGRCTPVCGDGIVVANEACDDGNRASSDGCSAVCLVEPGFRCDRASPSRCQRIITSVCGNNIVQASQSCDDGNFAPNDGCFNCNVENGWVCDPICRKIPPPPPPPPTPNCMTLRNNIVYQSQRMVLILVTQRPYTNLSNEQKRSFMKYSFPDKSTNPSSVFCKQNVDYSFECNVNYPYGLPNKSFNINWSYSYQGDNCSFQVLANPLAARFNFRATRGNDRL